MTKMEDEAISGEESKVAVPEIDVANDGSGEASFPERRPQDMQKDSVPPTTCTSCNEDILDKYYMKIDDRCWHEKCVHCSGCQQTFSESCFSKHSKLYCKECYKQIQFCCYRCNRTISGEEYVMRVGKDSYHIDCFLCDYCNLPLRSGDEFHSLFESMKRKICCKKCYDMDDVSNLKVTGSDSDESMSRDDVFSPAMPSFIGSPTHAYGRQMQDFYSNQTTTHLQEIGICSKNGKSPTTPGMMPTGDSKRTKRPRTILTTAQRRKFKASFEISQKPCRKVRETLANETGLTPRVVQVWFQNQRAKMKKMARRQNQGEGGTRRKKKKDVDSDSENELPSSPGSYTSAPTPHQSQYYGEYQSPRSVQSTPTQEDNGRRVFSPSYHQGFNHVDVPFDEFPRLPHPLVDQSYISAPNPGTHSPNELEIHKMLHERIAVSQGHDLHQAARDVLNHPNEMNGTHYANESMHDHFMSQHPQEVIDLQNEHPLGVPSSAGVSNPIDSLMYMQSNFFST